MTPKRIEQLVQMLERGTIRKGHIKEMLDAIASLRKAMAEQPEQGPVGYATKEDFYHELERRLKHIREEMKIKSVTMRCKEYDIALPIIDTDFGRVLVGQVSTPPQRTWVDLTDTQIEQAYFEVVQEHRGAPMPWGQVQFGRALLDKFKEVNT